MVINHLKLYDGEAPLIGQTQSVFDQNAGDILSYLATFGDDFNLRNGEINDVIVEVNEDAAKTVLNKIATNEDVVSTHTEFVSSATTTDSYATKVEDTSVNLVTSDGDIAFTYGGDIAFTYAPTTDS